MKKILQISGSLARSGQETFIMNVCKHINRVNFRIDFLVFTDSTDGYYAEAEDLGCVIFRLPSRKSNPFRYMKALDEFFRVNHYDVIHFHTCTLTTIAPLFYAKKHGINVRIVHSHSSKSAHGIHNYILHIINRLYIQKLATDYLACSDLAAKWFFKSRKRVVIVKNGINLDTFLFNPIIKSKIRSFLQISEDNFVVGHTGRFSAVKNHKFLLDVFKEVTKINSKSILLLLGVGETMSDIQKKAQEYGLKDRVIFLGEKENVSDYLQVMDAFVFPSLFEGLPFSLVEAQAIGLKVFAADTISKESKITDNLMFVSLQQSAKYWAKLIFENSRYYERGSLSNKQVEQKGFSIKKTVELLENIYNK